MGSKGNFDAYSELDERNFANREFYKKQNNDYEDDFDFKIEKRSFKQNGESVTEEGMFWRNTSSKYFYGQGESSSYTDTINI